MQPKDHLTGRGLRMLSRGISFKANHNQPRVLLEGATPKSATWESTNYHQTSFLLLKERVRTTERA